MKKFTADDILRFVASHETRLVEFKEARNALPNSFWESYSAFANTDGGTVILGVREKMGSYVIQGVDDAHRVIQELWNNVNNRQKVSANILFDRCVYAVDCSGKTVVVVDVPRPNCHFRPVFVGANPYTGSYRRNGEGDYRCGEETVDAMLRNRSREGGDCQLAEKLTVADLNQDTLRRYLTRLQLRRAGAPWGDIGPEEFLLTTGAARRDENGVVRPTLAALLMFGNFGGIVGEFPHYFVDYVEHLDDNPRYSDRISPLTADWSGNLYDFYSRVASRLTADVKTPFALDKEMYRIDDTPVHKSIRECLANTLVHADFYGRRGIRIDKYFRRITFANPGIFRVPLEIAVAGGTSEVRNDVLFTLFALVEIGEKLGTGLVQLFALWREHGWPAPLIQEQFDPERTVLLLDYNDKDDATPQKNGIAYGSEQENGRGEQENGRGSDGKGGGKNPQDGPEKTLDGPEKTLDGPEKTQDGPEKTQDGPEKTRNGPEKTQDGPEKTQDGPEKTQDGPEKTQGGPEKTLGGPEKTLGGPEKTLGGPEKKRGGTENFSGDRETQCLKILFTLKDSPFFTMKEIEKTLHIAERTIKRRLAELQQSGRLRRVGPDKGGHWEVLESGQPTVKEQ